MSLFPAERKPSGSPADKTLIPQDDELETIPLDGDWQALHIKTIQQQEDDEFVRDCPEDEGYEASRQRYLAAKRQAPKNHRERVEHVIGAVGKGVQAVKGAGGELVNQAVDCYEKGGAVAVARSTLSSGIGLAAGVGSTVLNCAKASTANWCGAADTRDPYLRQTQDGTSYSLHDLEEQRTGRKVRRDLSIDHEDGYCIPEGSQAEL